MVLEIVKYGSAVLRQSATPVATVTEELRNLAYDMIETMHSVKGVGLAAQQAGRLESVCVIDVPGKCEETEEIEEFNAKVGMPLIMFNPVVVATSGEQEGNEGCLSFPNIHAPLKRPFEVTCQYTDENGAMQLITVRGFLARAVMHETDHLRGVMYVDLLEEADRAKIEKKLIKLAKKNGGVE